MTHKNYFLAASTVFSLVAILHLLRLIYSFPIRIGTWDAPLWLSWLGLILAGFLAYTGYRLYRKERSSK